MRIMRILSTVLPLFVLMTWLPPVPPIVSGAEPATPPPRADARGFDDVATDPVQQRLDRERDDAVKRAAQAARRADQWRYRYHANRWWYYTPEQRWMYHDQTWKFYDPKTYVPAPPYTSSSNRVYYFRSGSQYLPAVRAPNDPAGPPNPITGKRFPDRILTGTPENWAPGDDPDTVFHGTRRHALGEGYGGATTEPVREPGPPAPAGKLP